MNPVETRPGFHVLRVSLLCALCLDGLAAERAVTLGANPVFSPDGSRIAFQRLEGGIFKVGVIPAAGGDADWIESGPGNAAYPAWTPDGALVYMAGEDTETAREAWKSGSRSGYGLRLWRNGEKRDLTRGRCRDYTPCVSPDGRRVWFVTTRGVESESASFSQAAASRLAVLSLAQALETEKDATDTEGIDIVLDAPNGNNSGYIQPAVSPDGSLLVWGQLDSFFDTWRIYGARLRKGSGGARPLAALVEPASGGARPLAVHITPSSLAALSPRFHPDGRLVCFTGFRAGDPGWGVWVEDIRTGKVRRLCDGENPCFSPDGASLAYDRDGAIFLRPFGPGDEPDATLPDIRDDAAPEQVLWSARDIRAETGHGLSGDHRFAFGDDTTFFVRATVRLSPGASRVRQILVADYAEHPRAIQLGLAGGEVSFAARDHAGKYFAARAPLPPPRDGAAHDLLAVRTPSRLLLAVDGAAPRRVFTGGALPLDTPQSLSIGTGLAEGDLLDSLEIGTGWPNGLPRTPTREALFR